AYHGGQDDSKPLRVGLAEASQGDVRFQSNQQRNRSASSLRFSLMSLFQSSTKPPMLLRCRSSAARFSCATCLDAQGNLKVWFWIQRFVPTIHGQNISFEVWYRADKEDKATEKL
ncbi:unnamed protein product, partial [Brassica oleracea]